MKDIGWREAAVMVLEKSAGFMHYTDIAQQIIDDGLRTEYGATPAMTVNRAIRSSIQSEEANSPFISDGHGYYGLKTSVHPPGPVPPIGPRETGLVNAFGMYWSRDSVQWTASRPRLFGQQDRSHEGGSTKVDFGPQKGVYLLHDRRKVVYVGRATDQPMGMRLRQHITDRLSGRWDRFSWFEALATSETGELSPPTQEQSAFRLDTFIATMEALLIEALEPPQNRRRGDADFRAIEFLQVADPEVENQNIISSLWKKLQSKQ